MMVVGIYYDINSCVPAKRSEWTIWKHRKNNVFKQHVMWFINRCSAYSWSLTQYNIHWVNSLSILFCANLVTTRECRPRLFSFLGFHFSLATKSLKKVTFRTCLELLHGWLLYVCLTHIFCRYFSFCKTIYNFVRVEVEKYSYKELSSDHMEQPT